MPRDFRLLRVCLSLLRVHEVLSEAKVKKRKSYTGRQSTRVINSKVGAGHNRKTLGRNDEKKAWEPVLRRVPHTQQELEKISLFPSVRSEKKYSYFFLGYYLNKGVNTTYNTTKANI